MAVSLTGASQHLLGRWPYRASSLQCTRKVAVHLEELLAVDLASPDLLSLASFGHRLHALQCVEAALAMPELLAMMEAEFYWSAMTEILASQLFIDCLEQKK